MTRKGDYILPVKGNQGRLQCAVQEFFGDHLEDDFARVKVSRFEMNERCHGWHEHRCDLQIDVPELLPGRKNWTGLTTWGMVIRTREIDGQETGEAHYYIRRLQRTAQRFVQAVRVH